MGVPNGIVYKVEEKVFDKFESSAINRKKSFEIADIILKEKKLKDKGVKIYNITEESFKKIKPCDFESFALLEEVAKGENAFFLLDSIPLMDGRVIKSNSIIINKEKNSATLLHELGHADNHNNSHFLKFISSISFPLSNLSQNMPVVASLTKNITPKNGQKLNKIQKAQNAIHKNSPLISFMMAIPQLIDEGAASYKAVQWAKKYGGEKYAKDLSKALLNSYMTYVTGTIGDIGSTAVAKISKDKALQKIEDKFIH